MTHENPTLKIRVETGNHWGASCHDVAKEIIGDRSLVLDAKWGREPSKWRETGGGWGRPKVSARDQGFLDAVRITADPKGIEGRLLEIIDRITQ